MNIEKLYLLKDVCHELSLRLPRFTQQEYSPYRATFRCDICGDSQKNKFKRRGFILEKSGNLVKYCHNCGYSASLEYYLKEYHPDLYQQFRFDLLRGEGKKYIPESKPVPKFNLNLGTDKLNGLIDVTLLPKDHKANIYLRNRQVPIEPDLIYYTDNFAEYINSIIPDKMPEDNTEARIVFPLKTEQGGVFGVIGRRMDGREEMKYLSVKFDGDHPKVYGLEKINRNKHILLLEGPIDSFFCDNALAMAGTDIDPDLILKDKKRYTIILDNQPRNREVHHKYERYIKNGNQIVIWPSHITEKDINSMITDGGLTKERVASIIQDNTYSGLKALTLFKKWKKLSDDKDFRKHRKAV